MVGPPPGSWRQSGQPHSDLLAMVLGPHPPQQGYDRRPASVQIKRGNSDKYGRETQPLAQVDGGLTGAAAHGAMRGVDLLASQLTILPNLPTVAPPTGLRTESWKWAVVRVTNIPWDISLQDMMNFFTGFPIPPEHLLPQNVHILMDRSTGKTFNSAFVELALTPQQAGLVAQSRNLKVLKGRLVTVELSSQDELLRSIFPKWTGQFFLGEPVLQLQHPDDESAMAGAHGGRRVITKFASNPSPIGSGITSSVNHASSSASVNGGGGGLLKCASGMENADDEHHKAEPSHRLSISMSSSTLSSSHDSLSKYTMPQEALTPSPTQSTPHPTLFSSNPATPPFVTRDEINALLVVCRNYKLHFSRKCAERPFENILSIIAKYPWHRPQLVLPLHRDHIFELLKLSIESLRVHLSKDFHTIHPTLLERMVRCAILTPAFTERQKAMVLHVAGCPCPENLLPWMTPPQPPQPQQQQDQPISDSSTPTTTIPSTSLPEAVAPIQLTDLTPGHDPSSCSKELPRPLHSSGEITAFEDHTSSPSTEEASPAYTVHEQETRIQYVRVNKSEDARGESAGGEISDSESVIERLNVLEMSNEASSSSTMKTQQQQQQPTATRQTPPPTFSRFSVPPIKTSINCLPNSGTKAMQASWATIAASNETKSMAMVSTAQKLQPVSPITDTDISLSPPSLPSLKPFPTAATAAHPQLPTASSTPSYAAALLQPSSSLLPSPPSPSQHNWSALDATSSMRMTGPSLGPLRSGGSSGGGARHESNTKVVSPFASGSSPTPVVPLTSLSSTTPTFSTSSSDSLVWAIKNITQSTPRLARSASQTKRE
ncbi:hypothetical protein BGZ73_007656 [Actinomortierella ambigua]|nr:hypothetical protein BGZ73_007656 [Actinomortierella ambigua]